MNRIILTFGLISGVVCSGLLVVLALSAGSEHEAGSHSLLLGYAILILGLSITFFGIKSYRDQFPESANFARCFFTGLGIVLVATIMYVLGWEIVYHKYLPDYIDKYSAAEIEKLRQGGAADANAEIAKMERMRDLYKNNTLARMGFTLLEIFPPGLVLSLVFAAILRRKNPPAQDIDQPIL